MKPWISLEPGALELPGAFKPLEARNETPKGLRGAQNDNCRITKLCPKMTPKTDPRNDPTKNSKMDAKRDPPEIQEVL